LSWAKPKEGPRTPRGKIISVVAVTPGRDEIYGLDRGLLELVKVLFWSNGKGPLILALFAAKKVDSGIAVEERGQFILVNNP
jgi:hypothetical protein